MSYVAHDTPIEEVTRSVPSFDDAHRSASPGDTIGITGRNRGDFMWTKDGRPEDYITLVLDSRSDIKDFNLVIRANYVRVIRGEWENSQIVLDGNNLRVAGQRFYNGDPGGSSSRLNCAVGVIDSSRSCTIDHIKVENWKRRSIRQWSFDRASKYLWIHHCHFKNHKRDKPANGRECIQIGSGYRDPNFWPQALIEWNLFEDFNLESELISLKSNGNIMRYNSIDDCPVSYIVCRTGSDNTLGGNIFRASRGIIVYGDNNLVIDNEMDASGILEARSGDCTAGQLRPQPSDVEGGHPASQFAWFVGNKSKCRIGKRGTGRRMYYDTNGHWAALDTKLSDHDGRIELTGKHEGTDQDAEGYDGPRFDKDRKWLLPGDVGPGALDDEVTQPPPPDHGLDDALELLDWALILNIQERETIMAAKKIITEVNK